MTTTQCSSYIPVSAQPQSVLHLQSVTSSFFIRIPPFAFPGVFRMAGHSFPRNSSSAAILCSSMVYSSRFKGPSQLSAPPPFFVFRESICSRSRTIPSLDRWMETTSSGVLWHTSMSDRSQATYAFLFVTGRGLCNWLLLARECIDARRLQGFIYEFSYYGHKYYMFRKVRNFSYNECYK